MKVNFTYKTLDVDLEKKEKTQDFLPLFQNFSRTGKLVGNFKNSRLCTNPVYWKLKYCRTSGCSSHQKKMELREFVLILPIYDFQLCERKSALRLFSILTAGKAATSRL